MIEDWDIPSSRPGSSSDGPEVFAVIPLPQELGGNGELLVQSAFGNMKLPGGPIQPRESSLRAVVRVVLGSTGVRVSPERLVYVVERPNKPIALCVLCQLNVDDAGETKDGVRFAAIGSSDGEFDPSPLRELLIEDVRSGFVRGVAHIAVHYDEDGREATTVTW